MSAKTQSTPGIEWDGTAWSVRLPMQDGAVVEARWNPGLTYVVRIRKAGTAQWGCGFETPLRHISFAGLGPDAEYEIEVRAKTAAGEGEPQSVRVRTGPGGDADNVIPFPRR